MAPDVERPRPETVQSKEIAARKAREAEREKARETPSLATSIKRAGRGGGKKKPQRPGTQRRRPLGKGQKPGSGVMQSGAAKPKA